MATKFEPRFSDQTESARLAAELTRAHEELLSELRNMEAIQSNASPDQAQWTSARWKLSRASRRRRMIVNDCYPLAMQSATALELTQLLSLRANDLPMLEKSRSHMEKWSREQIEADWVGYCAASAVIRMGMKERLVAERRIILPLLQRLAVRTK